LSKRFFEREAVEVGIVELGPVFRTDLLTSGKAVDGWCPGDLKGSGDPPCCPFKACLNDKLSQNKIKAKGGER